MNINLPLQVAHLQHSYSGEHPTKFNFKAMQHIEKKESLLSWQLCVASSVAKMLKEVTIHQHFS